MKTTSLIILGLLIAISGFSQKNKDFTFVPGGSFTVQESGTTKTISVENFWMSNEITNKEFRQFYNQVKSSPNDSISWVDLPGSKNGGLSKPKIISKSYSDILGKLMNESAWKSVFEKGDYFTNPNYDNYPVVGVTWEGAKYFCMWKTNQEFKKLSKQGNPTIMDYRLPTEYEWEYALTFNDPTSITGSKELHPIDKGVKNKIGLINLNSNVAEWTSSFNSKDQIDYKVVKGSSWKSESKEAQRELVLPNKGTDYIGFRIVQSEMKK